MTRFILLIAVVCGLLIVPAAAQEPAPGAPLCECEGANWRVSLSVAGTLIARNISRTTRGPLPVLIEYRSSGQEPGEILATIPQLRPGHTATVTQVLQAGPNMMGDAQVRVSYSYIDDSCVSDWARLHVIYFPFAYTGPAWQPTPEVTR